MIEGWLNDDYLVLFQDHEEALRMTELYGVRQLMPGYVVVGLRGWDDFILIDSKRETFTLPTVPLRPDDLQPFKLQADLSAIKADERFRNKIKWYVKPIAFGGDPSAKDNLAWVSLEQHAELVGWWSKLYRDAVANNQIDKG